MLVHAVVGFSSVDQARADLTATHGTAIAGIVLDARDAGAREMADRIRSIGRGWTTPISVLSQEPVDVERPGRRGWSFVTRPDPDGRGVTTALGLADCAAQDGLGERAETAILLTPQAVAFDELAGKVDHLLVDARRDGFSSEVDWERVAAVADRASREGRSRADTRRWDSLREAVTIAPLGDGLCDPSLVLPEGWSVDEEDLVEPRSTSRRRLDPSGWYHGQPRAGNAYDDAPLTAGNGGVVYVEERRTGPADLATVLDALGAPRRPPYAVFLRHARDVADERFVTEIRLFAGEALTQVLGWRADDPRVERSLPVADLLAAFAAIAPQEARSYGAYGEDGDDAYARVGLGIWVENANRGVLRCWSRPYLVLK